MNGIYKKGDIVELVCDTDFYKKGTKATVVNPYESNGNINNFEIRYNHEKYIGGDVDVMPKSLFKHSGNQTIISQ